MNSYREFYGPVGRRLRTNCAWWATDAVDQQGYLVVHAQKERSLPISPCALLRGSLRSEEKIYTCFSGTAYFRPCVLYLQRLSEQNVFTSQVFWRENRNKSKASGKLNKSTVVLWEGKKKHLLNENVFVVVGMISFPSRYKWGKNLFLIFTLVTEAHPSTLTTLLPLPLPLPTFPLHFGASVSFLPPISFARIPGI